MSPPRNRLPAGRAQTTNTSDTCIPRASAAPAPPCCGHTGSPRPSALPAAGPQPRTCVAVERAVWGWVAHEGQHSLAQAQQRPGRAPGRLQNVQADLARLHSSTTSSSSDSNNSNSNNHKNKTSSSSSTSTACASLPSSCLQMRHILHPPGATQRHHTPPYEDCCLACCGNPSVNTRHSGWRPDKAPLLTARAASPAACAGVCALSNGHNSSP